MDEVTTQTQQSVVYSRRRRAARKKEKLCFFTLIPYCSTPTSLYVLRTASKICDSDKKRRAHEEPSKHVFIIIFHMMQVFVHLDSTGDPTPAVEPRTLWRRRKKEVTANSRESRPAWISPPVSGRCSGGVQEFGRKINRTRYRSAAKNIFSTDHSLSRDIHTLIYPAAKKAGLIVV